MKELYEIHTCVYNVLHMNVKVSTEEGNKRC